MKAIKEFLRPTWKKVILLILVGIILSYSSLACRSYRDITPNSSLNSDLSSMTIILPSLIMECGLPFSYLKTITSPLCPQCHLGDFDIINNLYFVINLLCWYLIACLVIFILDKLEKTSFLNTKVRIAAWLLLISAVVSLYKIDISFIFLIITCIYIILIGYILKKKQRWLWYMGIIIIVLPIIFYLLIFLFFGSPMPLFPAISFSVLIFTLYALFLEKNSFFTPNN